MENILDKDHCHASKYTLEFHLCGVIDCDICACIGRMPCTPNVEVDRYNLQKEILRWNDLPVVDFSNKEHFLSPEDTWRKIEKDKIAFEALTSMLPQKKDNDAAKKQLD
eukprot:3815507-Ditylum_brightwellii.AAC.1